MTHPSIGPTLGHMSSAWIEERDGKYIVRWREPNDRRKHSKTVRTKAEARALRTDLEARMNSGLYTPKSARAQPFGDYVELLLGSSFNLERSTRYNHLKAFSRWIEPGLGDTPIGDIDANAARRFFDWMREQGASENTVARVRAQMTKYFRVAIEEGILVRNPLASVPAPKTERREIRVLTPAEVQGIADAHPQEYRLVPLLSAWGTFRIGEVSALQVSSIDGDLIRVSAAVGTAGGDHYLKGPKTAASKRTVRMPGWVMDDVRAHILRLPPGETFLFRTPHGKLLNHISYHPIWRRALAAVDFPKPWPRPHDLRHTAVALMIEAGGHPKKIQARCGHATMKETMDTYGHLYPDHEEELVRDLERFRPVAATVTDLQTQRSPRG